MSEPFYLTTAIFYANAGPHLGSALEIVAADAFARFKRLQGHDVFLLTGTDEHGQKIAKKAAELGLEPRALVDRNVEAFKAQFAALNIEESRFIRTTEEAHKARVVQMIETVRAKGDLTKGLYEGWYCTPCEAFWSQGQLKDAACPTCARAVEKDREEVWFFRQSKYGPAVLEEFRRNPAWVHPEGRGREMVNNFLAPGLEDVAVSRSRAKVPWGIPFPGDPDHVVYVWFDALTNYLSGSPLWPADLHIVGKDILRFHTTTWPAMLLSAGLPLPKRFFAHGWVLTDDGSKMSKSAGTVIDPTALIAQYQQLGVAPGLAGDVLRYALLREAPLAQDFVLTEGIVEGRYTRDLANDLGNLLSRTVSMTEKYLDGLVPAPEGEREGLTLPDKAEFVRAVEHLEFNRALEQAWGLISRANQLVDQAKPWVLAKDPAQKPRLSAVLRSLLEALQAASVLAWPVLPKACEEIRRRLGLPEKPVSLDEAWHPGTLKTGTKLTAGTPLFPRPEKKTPAA